jgi:hypothetical protein
LAGFWLACQNAKCQNAILYPRFYEKVARKTRLGWLLVRVDDML